MNYYVIIDSMGIIRGFQAFKGELDSQVAEGQTAYPISREIFEEVRTRDKKATSLFWDDDLKTVYVVDKEDDVLAAQAIKDLRVERDRRLAATDFTDLPHFPKTELFTAYRQALRDLPANTQDPLNPVWPVLSDEAKSYLKGK